MESFPNDLDLVADPVSHISISGFHGVDEVIDHMDSALTQDELSGVRRGPSLGTLLLGAAIGAAVMFVLDPEGGRRRRARARDKAAHLARAAGDRIRSRLPGRSDGNGASAPDFAAQPPSTDTPTA